MTIESLFNNVVGNQTTMTPAVFLLCMGTALVLGAVLALLYHLTARSTRSFTVTLALLPAVVCVVILMVNGNLGTGVAVAGAFSLVRFRSAPGTAREIGAIFLAMATGLAAGMGYLGYAALFTVIIGIVLFVYEKIAQTASRRTCDKILRITIPENLDYGDVFRDLFETYTSRYCLTRVKTTHLGSLFRLTYTVTLRDASQEKEFIDALRCRNGNLEISCSLRETESEVL